MAKKTEIFMTPKEGTRFQRGVRRFVHGDKISEAFLKDEKNELIKIKTLEKWKEPPKNEKPEIAPDLNEFN